MVWGKPFWAESVLPTDGRVADSLRFVKRDPLGLKVVADCWLADYPGGITIGVMKGSAQQRDAVLAAVKSMSAAAASKPATEAAEQESAGEGEQKSDRLEAGPTRKSSRARGRRSRRPRWSARCLRVSMCSSVRGRMRQRWRGR